MITKVSVVLICCLSSMAFAYVVDCEKPQTSDPYHNSKLELKKQEKIMQIYFLKTLEHHKEDKELVASIDKAQEAWKSYRDSHCISVYTMWRDGSIRHTMDTICQSNLTKERTHTLWLNFLTYMDSTPPVLVEPNR